MLNNSILFEDAVENFERPSPVDHEVFGNDLEPVDDRLSFKNVPVMWNAQTDSDPIIRLTIERVSRHDQFYRVRQKARWCDATARAL